MEIVHISKDYSPIARDYRFVHCQLTALEYRS